MTIDANDPRITAYVFGELRGEEQAEFEAALAQSNELQAIVAQTRKTVDLVESDLAAIPPTRLSQEQRSVVAAQFEQVGQWEAEVAKGTAGTVEKNAPMPLAGGPSPFPVWGVVAVAMTLLVIVGGGLFLTVPQTMVVSSRMSEEVTADAVRDYAEPMPNMSAAPQTA